MTPLLTIAAPGVQTTIQAGPRAGSRHLGVPASGAADLASLALANRLVGNSWDAPALEVTTGGFSFECHVACAVGLAGAVSEVRGRRGPGAEDAFHRTLFASAGERLTILPPRAGARCYLAVTGGLAAEAVLGSASTYLPAGLGGHEGRALRAGDALFRAVPDGAAPPLVETPARLRPPFARRWTLRAGPGPEAAALSPTDRERLFGEGWAVGRAASRVGVRLEGAPTGDLASLAQSAPVLPGTVQWPPGDGPIVLGPDCGTTGGYARVAQVIRADRHLIGQLRPGDAVRLLEWRAEDARAVHAEKEALLRAWVGEGFSLS